MRLPANHLVPLHRPRGLGDLLLAVKLEDPEADLDALRGDAEVLHVEVVVGAARLDHLQGATGLVADPLELEADEPFASDHCGTCTRCLEACPTDAFVAPHSLDATQCISYLTIELKGSIPVELREKMGGLVYGCDICQEVCPWNVKFSQELADDSPFAPRSMFAGKDARTVARELLAMSQNEFTSAFKGSPIKRAKLRGLKRNAAVVLGNVGTSDDEDLLTRALNDAAPLVREHVAWALARDH